MGLVRCRLKIDEVSMLKPILMSRTAPQSKPTPRSFQLVAARLDCFSKTTRRFVTTQADPRSNGATALSEVNERIEDRDIVTEASESYLSYAMSVIVGRALPDVRDGLKPVHRRILFGMYELRMQSDKPFKKCARVVGETLGKYHPHGDLAVYSALVRMAQDFSMRYTLINGHGNFGSVDNDPPAAMRYTECKLRPIASEMLLDQLEEDTVNFVDTFDASHQEPTLLPAKMPNLLLNGSSGIAVGVATKIPPHNITELAHALKALINNPEITVEELMHHVPAPDFPTGGEILRTTALRAVYKTGNGSVLIRGKVTVETQQSTKRRSNQRDAIIISELPYQTNKAEFVEHVAQLAENQTIQGIANVFDESDRDGMRVVIELKRSATTSVVLNSLYKHTQLQSRFSCNMIALVNGRPELLNLKQILSHFIQFRVEVITRRTAFQLKKANERLTIVAGLLKALENVEDLVQLLCECQGVSEARDAVRRQFELDEEQANAVVAMPVSRLTITEVQKLDKEKQALTELTTELKNLLSDPDQILAEVQKDVSQIARKYGDQRRSVLVDDEGELSDIDVIPNKPMIITFSQQGYVKRMEPDDFTVQRRGGKGVYGAKMRAHDTMSEILHVLAHDRVLFFTSDGLVYCLRAYEIPKSSRSAAGTPATHILPSAKTAEVTSIFPLQDDIEAGDKFLLLGTKKGLIKRTPLERFLKIRANGLIATKLLSGDELRFVQTCSEDSSVMLASDKGRVCRFNLDKLRPKGRVAFGVKGIKVQANGEVVGMTVLPRGTKYAFSDLSDAELESLDASSDNTSAEATPSTEPFAFFVTESGIGKLVDCRNFMTQLRGGLGTIGIKLKDDDKLVKLVLVSSSSEPQELIIASQQGMMTRMPVDGIRALGRYAKGVKVMNTNAGDRVTSVTTVIAAVEDA